MVDAFFDSVLQPLIGPPYQVALVLVLLLLRLGLEARLVHSVPLLLQRVYLFVKLLILDQNCFWLENRNFFYRNMVLSFKIIFNAFEVEVTFDDA